MNYEPSRGPSFEALLSINLNPGASYASGIVRTWNHDTGEILSTMRDKGEALCLSFNPHINILAVGKGSGEIKLYDEATLKVASILTKSKNPNLVDGHTNKIFCIGKSQNAKYSNSY